MAHVSAAPWRRVLTRCCHKRYQRFGQRSSADGFGWGVAARGRLLATGGEVVTQRDGEAR